MEIFTGFEVIEARQEGELKPWLQETAKTVAYMSSQLNQ